MKRNLLTIMLAFFVAFGVNAQKADLTKVTGVSENSKVIECAPEAIVSQALGDQSSAGNSNSTANSGNGYKKAAKVENWTYGDLASIRVFAGQLFYDGSWASCDTDPFSFNIVFYADNAGSPGTEIATYTETLTHVSTGDYLFGNSDYGYIYYWDWTPASAVAGLPETFWFSFQNNESDCWFMWLNTESGVGAAAGNDGTGWAADDYPLQYCLTNVQTADAAPAAVSNLVVTPSSTGAELWWTNPTETFSGNTLSELTSVGAWVSGTTEAIYTNTMAIIGGAENFTWTAPSNGEYTFTVYGTNSAGDGVSTDKTVWIGDPTISDAIPADGTVDLPTEVNFSWTANGATSYEVGIWKADDTPVYSNTTMTTTSFTKTLELGTDYKWSVKAVNAVGEATTGMMTFSTIGNPTIENIVPADGSTTTSNVVDFSWTSVGADSYEVGIWKSDDTPVYSNTTMTTTSFTQTLDWATDYKWSIKAINSFGETTTGMMTFTTAPDPTIVSFPWNEDFEGGALPAAWSYEYISGTIDWILENGGHNGNPAAAHGGSYNALFYSGNYNGDAAKLITPPMDLSGKTNYELSFWHAQVDWIGDIDSHKVFYREGVAGSWNELASYTTAITAWEEVTGITIPSTSSKVFLAFEATSGWGYGVVIDDITVDVANGVSNLNSNIKVYPNPSNGVFNVTVDGVYNVEVVDITGKVINTQTVENNATVNINNAGVYFLRFSNDKANFVEKVIVK